MPSFDAADVAGRLLGYAPSRVGRIRGGRNAEVWRVDTPDGAYALKRYIRSDAADRLGKETAALQFLARHGVETVPRVASADIELGVVLMRWLPGEPVSEASEKDILACADFLALLRDLSRAPDAVALPDAKESCGSVAAILGQIDARSRALESLSGRDSALDRFLTEEVAPRRYALVPLLRDYPAEFPRKYRILSPSDFGLHNALRDAEGRLSFLDFEYFGWDDPAKLAADFLLHPGMGLPRGLQRLFAARVCAVFCREVGFARRLDALLPAYQVRWSLIMMNPVLEAGGAPAHSSAEFAAVVRSQTERARRLLQAQPISASELGEQYVG